MQVFHPHLCYQVEAAPAPGKPKEIRIAMSSDRGLCGGIHSAVCKAIKAEVAASDSPDNIAIVCVGDKSRAQLQRLIYAYGISTIERLFIGRLPLAQLQVLKHDLGRGVWGVSNCLQNTIVLACEHDHKTLTPSNISCIIIIYI